MARGPLVGVMIVALGVWTGVAGAGTRKVAIESDPPGAAVYIEEVENGAACDATPCTIDAPIGSTPLILRKDKYEALLVSIDVPKRGKLKPFKYTLKSAIGTIVIEDAAAKGASIKIDDVDKGTAPARVDVDADAHHVVLSLKGKTLYDDIVNVEVGDEVVVKPKAIVSQKDPPPEGLGEGGPDGGGSDGEGDGSDEEHVTAHAPAAVVDAPFITGGAVFDVGFRQFRYRSPQNLPATEDEGGQVMIGPAAEFWPAPLFGWTKLRGLSLYAMVEFGVNHQAVTDMAGAKVGPTTLWGGVEVDVRHKWMVGDAAIVEANGGFVRDQLEFYSSTNQVPSADYKSLRIGGRGMYRAGWIIPYGGIEGRIVLSGGELAKRFQGASASGARASVGASVSQGMFFGRVEASLVYYGWSFKGSTTTMTAQGATDIVEVISILVGVSR